MDRKTLVIEYFGYQKSYSFDHFFPSKLKYSAFKRIVQKGAPAPLLFSSPFLISPPLLRNMQTPLPPLDRKYLILWWYNRMRETENNTKPWNLLPLETVCLSTECVLIDIIVTISKAVGTGCNFPHGEVGTKSRHIKTYCNRLTISYTIYVHSLINSWLMTHFKNKLKPHAQTETKK